MKTMVTALAILAWALMIPGVGRTQNSPSVPAPQVTAPASQTPSPEVKNRAPVTTNRAAPADTAKIQLPLPAMKNIITTEKPIKGMPTGIVPKTGAGPDASGSAASPASAADGAIAASKPGAPAGAPAGADSAALAVLPPQSLEKKPSPTSRPEKPAVRKSDTYHEELSIFNTPTANLRTMKIVIDDQYNLVGMVYGEQLGFIRILNADNNGDFTEVWKSPPLNSEVRGVFVENIDRTGEAEIVAYTAEGNIFIYGYDTHELKYKTPDGTYQGIICMALANIDDSPELEFLFITKAGKMVQFDPVTRFEEWTSTETYTATDMVIGNVDNDRDPEIILNTGEVLNFRFKSVKWKLDVKFVQPNTRLYLIDMDSDGILELVVEYDQGYVQIFDVDQRREKW